MPDVPAPDAEIPLLLEAEVVPCWRCGGASRRHAMRYDPCEVCEEMLREIARCYQGQRPAPGETHGKGDTDEHE